MSGRVAGQRTVSAPRFPSPRRGPPVRGTDAGGVTVDPPWRSPSGAARLLVAVLTAVALLALAAGCAVPGDPMTAGASAPGDRGSYAVPGLGARKQAVLAAGGTSLDLAVAMLETETMTATYPVGDGKTGDAANFGIFKQNWLMIRGSAAGFDGLRAADYRRGEVLNGDLPRDLEALHVAQRHWPLDLWFAGHRRGESGLARPDTADVAAYREAVYWIRDRIDADAAHRADDTRFWVDITAI